MKYLRITSLIIVISILLSSCVYTRVEPNIKGNNIDKNLPLIDNIQKKDDITLKENNNNKLIDDEIKDRKLWYDKLNKNKEYLQAVQTNLDLKISSFKKYVEITRQLELADLKIVKAVVDWFLDEKSINKNNYYYLYLQENKNNKKEILKDLWGLITLFSNQKEYNNMYYSNFDLSKVDQLNKTSTKIYFYTNYYLYKMKYTDDISNVLSNILKYFEILKINKYSISENKWGFFTKKTYSYIYYNNIKTLYEELKK